MAIKNVDIASLKAATYNPSNRLEVKKLRNLIKSIQKIGLVYPIVIASDNRIIDGHRRWEACKKLGHTTIQAIVVAGDDIHDEYFASLNSCQAKLTGNDHLGIWLKNPAAVPNLAGRRIAEMASVLGTPLVRAMYRNRLSVSLYRRACELLRRLDAETPEMLQRAIRWSIAFNGSQVLMRAASKWTSMEDARTVCKAIRGNCAVTLKPSLSFNGNGHSKPGRKPRQVALATA